jgi:hypothetical protein
MAILIAAAILSLTAQVSEAKPSVSGWISSAVPALAFLALTKLVLSSPRTTPEKENPRMYSDSGQPADPGWRPGFHYHWDAVIGDPCPGCTESDPDSYVYSGRLPF